MSFVFDRYGIGDHTLTQKLIEHAKTLPSSFDPPAPRKYGGLATCIVKLKNFNTSQKLSAQQFSAIV